MWSYHLYQSCSLRWFMTLFLHIFDDVHFRCVSQHDLGSRYLQRHVYLHFTFHIGDQRKFPYTKFHFGLQRRPHSPSAEPFLRWLCDYYAGSLHTWRRWHLALLARVILFPVDLFCSVPLYLNCNSGSLRGTNSLSHVWKHHCYHLHERSHE